MAAHLLVADQGGDDLAHPVQRRDQGIAQAAGDGEGGQSQFGRGRGGAGGVDYGRSQRIEEAAQGQGQKESEELALARRITHVGLEIPIPAETDGRQEFEPELGAEAGVMAEGVDEIEPRAEELLRWGSGARPPRR